MGNIFVWTFTVLQWNCIGRSASIDPLGIHNLGIGAADSYKIKYDDSKSDSTGEKVSPKNMYANPFDPTICSVTALGIWLENLNETFTATKDSIFIENGEIGTAHHRYCCQLVEILKDYIDIVRQYCRPDRANNHGVQKGSATYAISWTPCPPPLPAVAKRGELSQGTIFNIYLLFAEPGDNYLGRILSGLDPNSGDFAVLPPHFDLSPCHPYIKEALKMCFGNILNLYEDTNGGLAGVFTMFLASIVFHMDTFIRPIIERDSKHPFATIPLLQAPELLRRLQEKVTVDKTSNLNQPTGVPPQVGHTIRFERAIQVVTHTLKTVQDQGQTLQDVVIRAIESRDAQAGILTITQLEERLKKHHDQLEELLHESPNTRVGQDTAANDQTQNPSLVNQRRPLYNYGGRLGWHAPQGWNFPTKTLRKSGWRLWLKGIPGVVRPFRSLDPKFLPSNAVKDRFKLEWRHIFQMMENAIDFD
jgi:hypothetical protein